MVDAFDLYFAAQMGARDEKEKETLAALMATSREGHLCLACEEKIEISTPYVRWHGNRLYLERNWIYETEVVTHLSRLFSKIDPLPFEDTHLTAEQKQAVTAALSYTVSILSGGPGTGKTFVARQLATALGAASKIIFVAPTGKAAARLGGKTIHSALMHPLNADLIVVDETSMVDARLFAKFLSSIKTGTRLLFMGDPDQLPPVESGSFFTDLVDLLPTSKLTIPMRSDRKEILTLAEAIRKGEEEVVLSHLLPLSEFKVQGQILSCMREGPFGVDTLNRRLAEDRPKTEIPILITKTDYNIGLYNGDVGLLRGGEAYFEGRVIPRAHLPPFEYAFCLSVHKSQGSEFEDVSLLVPPGSEVFGREILYTGVTRAKQSVKIYGEKETLQALLSRRSRKISGLRERLQICAS